MSIRATITLFTVPLFLLIALVNGALLYFQEEAEISQALDDQAEAAAVTAAQFAARIDRPLQVLAQPKRRQAMANAVAHLPDVEALYLVAAGSPPLALVPASQALDVTVYRRPNRIEVRPVSGAPRQRHVVALAPAGPGAFVVARIDAEPLMNTIANIRRIALAIVLVAGLIALALAWYVARRITRELQVSAATIAAREAGGSVAAPVQPLTIREARDLADAVRLMTSNNDAAARRDRLVLARNDQVRTMASAFAAWRQTEFSARTAVVAGRSVALRMMGAAPIGSFFALCQGDGQAMIVIGRCGASAAGDALADALAARRFLEAQMFAIPAEECLALARTAFGIADLRTVAWSVGQDAPVADSLIALTDDASAHAATAYAQRNPDASPDELLDGIAVLASPDGVFAVLGSA